MASIEHLDPEGESERCPTCGQRVSIFTGDEGTSYYVATAEQEASELVFVREQRDQLREELLVVADALDKHGAPYSANRARAVARGEDTPNGGHT